jgi:hypothetical protein
MIRRGDLRVYEDLSEVPARKLQSEGYTSPSPSRSIGGSNTFGRCSRRRASASPLPQAINVSNRERWSYSSKELT